MKASVPFYVGLSVTVLYAQADTIVNPTVATPTVQPLPSVSSYVYAGCWNETIYANGSDGSRALSGSTVNANNFMTAERCIQYCAQGGNGAPIQYAGIEYGRECYCAQYISRYSYKLNDSSCMFACDGNASQICGGANTLTVYNYTMAMTSEGVAAVLPGFSIVLSMLLGLLLL